MTYIVGKNHIVSNAILLTKLGLFLQITQSSVIRRSIRRHTGDHTRSLGHADSQQRQRVNLLIPK